MILAAMAVTGCAQSETAPPLTAALPGEQMAQSLPASVPAGFRANIEAEGISQPGGLATDDLQGVWLIEAGNRLVRLGADGGRDLIAEGAAGTLWNGVAVSQSVAFVSGSGPDGGSRLLRIDSDGRTLVLLDLPPGREAPLAAPAIGPDGRLYVATMTLDDQRVVRRPCQDVGRKKGSVPCDGAVLSLGQDGGPPQLVAWGFRSPRELGFTADGRLFALDGDRLYAVAPGVWYGWPDQLPRPNPPPPPLARFSPAFTATVLAVGGGTLFGGERQAYVALSSANAGFRVVRIDLVTGAAADFARFPGGGRAVAMSFTRGGEALYLLDDVGTLWRIAADLPVG